MTCYLLLLSSTLYTRSVITYILISEKKLPLTMSKAHPPELKKFMDKKISLRINGSRQVEGILCGFDPFMNLVLDDATEYNKDGTPKNKIGNIIFFH